ncbi:GrpB family protein [Sinomonas sp. JGH33]|uniref:GrpB family protein n=1 Tax=Sinomonas terricola TaxID=3110330 RepID=A0ABU5T3H4_9MICC|nr:GrpB family protein [Sinomonas sp. JGH33]MEA5453681.1 GrpB family protein [Sinomonas sp. JGH33]
MDGRSSAGGGSREATQAWREAVMAHHVAADGGLEWVGGAPAPARVRVVEYDDAWPAQFDAVAARIRGALGDAAIAVDHVGSTSQVNLHVFGPGCPETERHRMFREWLRTHPTDRDEYREAKLDAARATSEQLVMNYNRHKEPTIRAIYERMFRAAGWLDGDGPTPDGKE